MCKLAKEADSMPMKPTKSSKISRAPRGQRKNGG